MDVDQIPAAMVEAAARVMYNADRPPGTDWWGTSSDPDERAPYRVKAAGVLAAALGVCEVREEEGGRCARDGDVFGQPGHAFSARSWLATRSYSQPDAHLIRRLVITTPAQPVTEGETDGS